MLRTAELFKFCCELSQTLHTGALGKWTFTPPTLCPLTPKPDVKKYFLKHFCLSAHICARPVEFQLSETIWWWIEPYGEAPLFVYK